MAQLGMYVPAKKARFVSPMGSECLSCIDINRPIYRLCPVDAILTRMGAYDNMFSNASTFKVELDEWYVTRWTCLVTQGCLYTFLAVRFFETRLLSPWLFSTVS